MHVPLLWANEQNSSFMHTFANKEILLFFAYMGQVEQLSLIGRHGPNKSISSYNYAYVGQMDQLRSYCLLGPNLIISPLLLRWANLPNVALFTDMGGIGLSAPCWSTAIDVAKVTESAHATSLSGRVTRRKMLHLKSYEKFVV